MRVEDNAVLAVAQPTAAPTPAPTAAPRAAPAEPTATAPSAVATKRASDLLIDEQKKALVAVVNERLAGLSDETLSRLKLPPDARDHRQGGIWVTIEFNGDEYETIPISKEHLDKMMRDTYEALFTAGYDLRQADMTAIVQGTKHRKSAVRHRSAFRSSRPG